jgi:hypothetical protein
MIGDDWGAADAARKNRARAEREIIVPTLAASRGREAREGRRWRGPTRAGIGRASAASPAS